MSEELKCECKEINEVQLCRNVNSYGACQVRCRNCGRSGPMSIEINGSWKDCTEEEAIAAWNHPFLKDELVTALEEATDDMVPQIELEYPKDLRDKYPDYQRRYDRDMEQVTKNRALIKRARS